MDTNDTKKADNTAKMEKTRDKSKGKKVEPDEGAAHCNSDSNHSSEASDSNDSDADEDIAERKDIPEQFKSQVDRLKAIRERLAKSTQENKRDVYKEHQRLRENPRDQRRQERKHREAEILKEKEEYSGQDYERSRFWEYSIDRVEKYEERKRKIEENAERGFTDFTQVNRRKYERDVAKIKPDLTAYGRQKQERALGAEGSEMSLDMEHKPDHRNVEKLVKTVEDQQQRRAALHKPSVEKEGENVSYINERNARFNRKMDRAYDKYTKEIRDNFERGTAL
ncbi:pre-mRNA-splicing factor SYF2 [Coemansia sp. RSA 1813]|nr:Pre-mRNA-splicing factor SYF2 [Coemansia sp. RSA 1646]KAJ1767180.1 pre-mRNA-splicing factor SYF2 [Coemansia sp. RSA 1843]KAJ2089529.1 pre-mRNA-splicing factor SYF2 [Coemansia sp. RSA 986]KAJ2214501.1 pre-mRNA-splicing factor SYF2 [Coemansia sp. RSA 487]KAJ2569383.1 pre-mRNA-splicing factor SYF2 [Coemansia sp. RSA 1813]